VSDPGRSANAGWGGAGGARGGRLVIISGACVCLVTECAPPATVEPQVLALASAADGGGCGGFKMHRVEVYEED